MQHSINLNDLNSLLYTKIIKKLCNYKNIQMNNKF